MLKQELREIYLTKRKNLTSAEVTDFSKQISENFLNHFEVQKGDKIHIFQSITKFNEVDTSRLIHDFFEKGARVFVPKMNGDHLLAVEITPDSEMALNSWGISEPVSNLDAAVVDYKYVITPLLYCDPQGNRVGYGKGFYDRFFAGLLPKTKKVGVGFFPPAVPISDLHAHDIPLDYLVTRAEVLSFGS